MDPMMPPGPPMTPNFNGGPLQPLMPGLNYPMSNKMVRGFGKLTWLSPKAGLITCHKMNGVTVSFQLKDFVDNVRIRAMFFVIFRDDSILYHYKFIVVILMKFFRV